MFEANCRRRQKRETEINFLMSFVTIKIKNKISNN